MWNLAQTSLYNYQNTSSSRGSLWLIYLVLYVIFAAALWKVFVKADQEGWKAIIPIYNSVIMFNIVGMSGWYALLLFIPFVNIVVAIVLVNKLAKAFGQGIGMTLLLIVGIGYLILGFGNAKYLGPGGTKTSSAAGNPPPAPAQ